MTCVAYNIEIQLTKPSNSLDTSPKSEPALEPHSRVAPSQEAHHCSDVPDAGRKSRGRQTKKSQYLARVVHG